MTETVSQTYERLRASNDRLIGVWTELQAALGAEVPSTSCLSFGATDGKAVVKFSSRVTASSEWKDAMNDRYRQFAFMRNKHFMEVTKSLVRVAVPERLSEAVAAIQGWWHAIDSDFVDVPERSRYLTPGQKDISAWDVRDAILRRIREESEELHLWSFGVVMLQNNVTQHHMPVGATESFVQHGRKMNPFSELVALYVPFMSFNAMPKTA